MVDISGHLRSLKQEVGFADNKSHISVNCCGYQKFKSKNFKKVRERGRVDYQIIYIVKGSGKYFINGAFQDISEGNIIVFRPGEPQIYSYSFETSTEVYWIHFTGYGADNLLNDLKITNHFIGSKGVVTELFKEIINELQIKRPYYELHANAAFVKLLVLIGRLVTKGAIDKKEESLEEIVKIMHTCYNLKWSVSDLADKCNLSKYRFIHNFKKYTGAAPMEFLFKIKIDKARGLLIDSSLNIGEIASVLGYDNPLYFSRVFKKAVGMSPSKYRLTHLT
ncbi:MAG: AraC family transcriptional regulator [Firmicutes bacterium]|nr:AraC family transcriptional regulator [Bacillota bacterium]